MSLRVINDVMVSDVVVKIRFNDSQFVLAVFRGEPGALCKCFIGENCCIHCTTMVSNLFTSGYSYCSCVGKG